ncbi:hypothetical protein [Ancrocorticia populi]|uniref:hypothetical protein n=1 Tax=Ancrocorticia populi TaxID=2175228 RepID=UPI003F98C7EB
MSDLPLRIAGDRVTDIITLLTRIIDDVPVADSLPGTWQAERDGPRIVVEGDGTPTSSPVHTGQAVRVILHALTRPEVVNLMDTVDALLLAYSALGIGFAIRPGQRLIVTKDGDGEGTHFIASAGYTVEASRKETQHG